MEMSKNERMDLLMMDVYYTFSDMVDMIDELTEKLEETTDIIEKINDTIETAAITAPSMEKFYIPWDDIKKVLEFIELYGNKSKYSDTLYTCEKVARAMHRVAQNKVLSE